MPPVAPVRREQVPLDVPVTRAEMADAFTRIAGTDLGMGEPRWSTRFLSERRQARKYRVGRVFLAAMPPTCTRRWTGRA